MSDSGMFRPPIVRSAGAVLDRALFSKTIPLAAARVLDRKLISKSRILLEKSRDLLRLERVAAVRDDPVKELATKGVKCLLLKPEIKVEDSATWSEALRKAVDIKELDVVPFELQLDYDYWTYRTYVRHTEYAKNIPDFHIVDVMKAILPEDAQDEIPVGFAIVGHIAHLNLRDQYLPYKHLIAEVIRDKNPTIRTVINKIDNVGIESEYRTFAYELLAGPEDMNVEIREEECTFKFNYSKVYWNTRLGTEHKRLVDLFNPGEVVCDVMAGVGPFAIPAGKKGVFVWANDLNPDSFSSMKDAVSRNKVSNFVRPFCENGRQFIHQAADELLSLTRSGENTISIPVKRSRHADPSLPVVPPKVITIPRTISHFVMNLPATATEFIPSYKGVYSGQEMLFEPYTNTKLPMVHVHCFSTKSDDNVREGIEITQKVSDELGVPMKFGGLTKGDGDASATLGAAEREVIVHDVRDVAPLKRMFCASFRLPAEVAFAARK